MAQGFAFSSLLLTVLIAEVLEWEGMGKQHSFLFIPTCYTVVSGSTVVVLGREERWGEEKGERRERARRERLGEERRGERERKGEEKRQRQTD